MDTYIHQHGKIGDMILCNGLVRYLLKKKFRNNKIYLFCRSRHLKAIKFMYRDQKRIKLIPFNENPKLKDEKLLAKYEVNKTENIIQKIKLKKKINFIRIGFENYHKTKQSNPDKDFPWPCDIVFYKQFNVPFKYRFLNSYWKRDKKNERKLFRKLVGNNQPYVFIHDDKDRNLVIDEKNINPNLKIIRNDNKELIFNFRLILERAKEIHIMESSFRQIIEVLNTDNIKLYLYKGRGGEHSIELFNRRKKKWIGTSKKWNIVKKNIDLNKNKKNFIDHIIFLVSRLNQKIIYHLNL
jgi:hypothetical protein